MFPVSSHVSARTLYKHYTLTTGSAIFFILRRDDSGNVVIQVEAYRGCVHVTLQTTNTLRSTFIRYKFILYIQVDSFQARI